MISRVLRLIIKAYKLAVSPVLPPSCRFYPTCSDYASGAIEAHGPAKGVFLASKRLFRCHPYNPGGYDPVPSPRFTLHTHNNKMSRPKI